MEQSITFIEDYKNFRIYKESEIYIGRCIHPNHAYLKTLRYSGINTVRTEIDYLSNYHNIPTEEPWVTNIP